MRISRINIGLLNLYIQVQIEWLSGSLFPALGAAAFIVAGALNLSHGRAALSELLSTTLRVACRVDNAHFARSLVLSMTAAG